MILSDFSRENLMRCLGGFKHLLEAWSTAEWTNAMAGEAGEACNIAKKIIRHRDGIPNKANDQDLAELRHRCALEAADAIIYADLLIQHLGFDTAAVLAETWNAKSKEIGWPIRIGR